ncbi:hypothetical protein TYRP_005851 [Tyrophagus putrescentiae]|nr:hypothetical protein TYRP_005851 [Tyrophagus putrescentiae]
MDAFRRSSSFLIISERCASGSMPTLGRTQIFCVFWLRSASDSVSFRWVTLSVEEGRKVSLLLKMLCAWARLVANKEVIIITTLRLPGHVEDLIAQVKGAGAVGPADDAGIALPVHLVAVLVHHPPPPNGVLHLQLQPSAALVVLAIIVAGLVLIRLRIKGMRVDAEKVGQLHVVHRLELLRLEVDLHPRGLRLGSDLA